ncbi:hypothetical protein HUX88_22880 [Duganella sp. BJB1802]|uniref:hypothetical protein n=1 Tax=Duganella sp. BJB1802 TaxID=2744575 RepID=UPI0015934E69|nr:hypothetical protein [Duganella sp. BJB1802]NVD73359.1 hypothetical protein [Duganella sp. BJB1802]
MFFKRKKKYRVLVEGTNLLMEMQGIERLGYFTTRYVEAMDPDEASEYALDLVRNELNSTGALLNNVNDPPVAIVSEIEQIGSFRGIDVPGMGFTFFPEKGTA